MWNDAGLQREVEDAVCWELNTGRTRIAVKVKAGAVELSGHVDSFWEKCAAERAAWRVAHVHHVTNGIRVEIPFDRQRADDDIALAAMGNLEWNCLVPPTVEVQVSGGVVTLSGSVARQLEREEAERALGTMIGITGIRNEIVVKPGAGAADVKTPIEAALRRSALGDRSHVKVHVVAQGVVSLRGTVRSRAEYEEAMQVAWAAPGISKVEDHLTIGSAAAGE